MRYGLFFSTIFSADIKATTKKSDLQNGVDVDRRGGRATTTCSLSNPIVIKITPYRKKKKNYDKLDRILKISFRQRRKTIKNNLKTFYVDAEKKIFKCGIDPNSRPQDLKPIDFVKLSKLLI